MKHETIEKRLFFPPLDITERQRKEGQYKLIPVNQLNWSSAYNNQLCKVVEYKLTFNDPVKYGLPLYLNGEQLLKTLKEKFQTLDKANVAARCLIQVIS